MSSNSNSGTQARGAGPVGGSPTSKGVDSQSGGREMGDNESSMKGDTSSQPNVNNEYPSSGGAGANIKTDSESAKFSSDGSSESTFATK